MRLVVLGSVLLFVVACDSTPEGPASATASAAPAPAPTHTTAPAPPTASAAPSASAAVLPGTALKDVLKDVKSVMALGRASGPMGTMISDKKDVAALLAAIGTDQTLKKAFESDCVTPTKLDFQSKDGKSLGAMGFCEGDTFTSGRFDGSGAEKAEITIKNPAGFKAVMQKVGAIK